MRLNQITLPSRDIARGRDFYLKLGFELIVDSAHYARLAAPDGRATLSLHLADKLGEGEGATVYLECADVDAVHARLAAAGIAFESAPTDQSWLWREARFRDPDGNRLCLYHAGCNRLAPPWRVTRAPVSKIEFWYEFASTYSYPAAMRIEDEAAVRGVEVLWKPFLLGPIFKAQQGLSDSPFNVFETKGRYMWRDMARITSALGLPFRRPAIFPQNGLLAARTAIALEPGLKPAFSRAVYAANFAEGRDISDGAVIADLLAEIGADARPTLALAATPETKERLRHETEAAMAAGLFGAPSFRAGEELFWGNDRLEAALDWAAGAPNELGA